MAKDKSYWDNKGVRRYVLDPDDVGGLEREAGVHEFIGGKPQAEAEEAAYQDYTRKNHMEAAAHHLTMMKAAQANGKYNDAHRHKLIYDMHLKSLGIESEDGKVPSEIDQFMQNPDAPRIIKYKPHKADALLENREEEDMKPLSKHEIGHALYNTLKKYVIQTAHTQEGPAKKFSDIPDHHWVVYPHGSTADGGAIWGFAGHMRNFIRPDTMVRNIPHDMPKSPVQFISNPVTRSSGPAHYAFPHPDGSGSAYIQYRPRQPHQFNPESYHAYDTDPQTGFPVKNDPQATGLHRNEGTVPSNAQADFGMSESFGDYAWEEMKKSIVANAWADKYMEDFLKSIDLGDLDPLQKGAILNRLKRLGRTAILGGALTVGAGAAFGGAIGERHPEVFSYDEKTQTTPGLFAPIPVRDDHDPSIQTPSPQEAAGKGAALGALAGIGMIGAAGLGRRHRDQKPLHLAEKKPYMGRDEGIRRGKLAPGTPDADKYGVAIQEDKKKKAAKEAARKWKHKKGDE